MKKPFSLFLAILSMGAVAAADCSIEDGQDLIGDGKYARAIQEFTCVIEANPTAVEGYRGRIEASLMLRRFSDAARDHARIVALVLPVHPGAQTAIITGYKKRLNKSPNDIPALTGASFAYWWFFEYDSALPLLERLVALQPRSVYGNAMRGSNRLFLDVNVAGGLADIDRAIELDPRNPQLRWLAADAFTYAEPNFTRAFAEAQIALNWGLDTPRIRAILGTVYLGWGNMPLAAHQYKVHIDQVTCEYVAAPPLAEGAKFKGTLVPGRTFEIPVMLAAGQKLSVATSSKDFYDTILVLLDPAGKPVAASDDFIDFFAGLEWTAPAAGRYKMLVTSFESVNTGVMTVARTL